MGLRDYVRRSARGASELETDRLCAFFEQFHLTSLHDMPTRQRVDVCGEIRRMSVKPRSGIPAVEVEISDGTGELTVVFSGRKTIPGIMHGRPLAVSGVAYCEGDRRIMLNPAYRLLPRVEDLAEPDEQ
ncbi:MAG: hypothetical protein ACO3IV_04625 [Ilumatobacteraceae bacterium]